MKLHRYLGITACTLGLIACGGTTKPDWQQNYLSGRPTYQSLSVNDARQLQRISGNVSERRTETFASDGSKIDDQVVAVPVSVAEPAQMQTTADGYVSYSQDFVEFVKFDLNMQAEWRYSESASNQLARHSGVMIAPTTGAIYFWNRSSRALSKLENGQITARYSAFAANVENVQLIKVEGGVAAFAVTNMPQNDGFLMVFDEALSPLLQTDPMDDLNGAMFNEGSIYTDEGQMIAIGSQGQTLWTHALRDPSVDVEKIEVSANNIYLLTRKANHFYVEAYTGNGDSLWHYERSIPSNASASQLVLTALPSGNVAFGYASDITVHDIYSDANKTTTHFRHVIVSPSGTLVRTITQEPSIYGLPAFCHGWTCWGYSTKGPVRMADIVEMDNGQLVILSSRARNSSDPYYHDLQAY